MTKSSWKIPYVDYTLLSAIMKNRNFIKTNSRSSVILESFIGKTILVYDGAIYRKVIIYEDMVGHKLGEFCFTRVQGNIHLRNKK